MEGLKFACSSCGLCCTLSPVSLLPHEDMALRFLANAYNLKYRSFPGYKMYDEISGFNLAFSYVMELVDGKCTFLENNLCLIHNVAKPLICRSYPFVPKQVKYFVDNFNRRVYTMVEHGLSMKCPVVSRDLRRMESVENPYRLAYFYTPNEFLASLEMERARNIYFELLSALWKKRLVELTEEKPGAPVINLYQFLRTYFPEMPNLLNIQPLRDKR
uniref:YkgJ family cysteine cluster protein n=1 Tax=Thermosphaera aggregans TaxID=54254 RepID=A0A7C2FY06_9CREN